MTANEKRGIYDLSVADRTVLGSSNVIRILHETDEEIMNKDRTGKLAWLTLAEDYLNGLGALAGQTDAEVRRVVQKIRAAQLWSLRDISEDEYFRDLPQASEVRRRLQESEQKRIRAAHEISDHWGPAGVLVASNGSTDCLPRLLENIRCWPDECLAVNLMIQLAALAKRLSFDTSMQLYLNTLLKTCSNVRTFEITHIMLKRTNDALTRAQQAHKGQLINNAPFDKVGTHPRLARYTLAERAQNATLCQRILDSDTDTRKRMKDFEVNYRNWRILPSQPPGYGHSQAEPPGTMLSETNFVVQSVSRRQIRSRPRARVGDGTDDDGADNARRNQTSMCTGTATAGASARPPKRARNTKHCRARNLAFPCSELVVHTGDPTNNWAQPFLGYGEERLFQVRTALVDMLTLSLVHTRESDENDAVWTRLMDLVEAIDTEFEHTRPSLSQGSSVDPGTAETD